MTGAEPTVSIRAYEVRDEHAVRALAVRLTSGVAPWRDPAAVATAAQQWVDESLDRQDAHHRPIFVAHRGQNVVGFVAVSTRRHWSGDVDAYVGELAVAASASGRGVGRALMAAVERWARSRGFVRLTLQTGAQNEGARSFYRALGYQEEEVVLTRDLSSPSGGASIGSPEAGARW